MDVIADYYINHFDQYGCNFYKSASTVTDLADQDSEWLSEIGLPDGAIPFFFFDFHIGYLRDVEIPSSKFMLGTAFQPASRHYIYIDDQDQVTIQMENKSTYLVNSSLRQLCACIYAYSRWLEDQEDQYTLNAAHCVSECEMFDLYYQLRALDRQAFSEDASIWPLLVNSEVRFLSDSIGEDC